MVLSLQHRDLAPCMQWIIARKNSLEQQMIRVQAEIASIREGIMTEMTDASSAASDTPLSPTAVRRKRVSFSAEEKQGAASSDDASAAAAVSATAASSPSSAAVSRVSSLTTHLYSLQSFYGSLHELQFDLHRLKFLQILMDSEDSTRRAKQRRRSHAHAHKRKGDTNGEDVESAEPRSSNGNGAGGSGSGSGLPPRKDHRKLAASESSMRDDPVTEEEEEAALAADQTSSDEGEEHDEREGNSDDDLNALAASASRAAGSPQPAGREAPTSYSHHAALKYAQQFFPPFAGTRMEGQTHEQQQNIRKLSGCILLLGQLTSSSPSSPPPSHPYSSLFSRSSNTRMWRDVLERTKRLYFQHIQRPDTNPVLVSLRAADVSLPQLLKYQSVLKLNPEMLARRGPGADNPEVELGPDFQYHSTLICSVTKEQCSTTADTNIGAPSIEGIQQPQSLAGVLASGMYGEGMAAIHAMIAGRSMAGVLSFGVGSPASASASAAAAASSSAASSSAASAASVPLHPLYSNPPVLLKCGHCISAHAMEKIIRNLRMSRSDEHTSGR